MAALMECLATHAPALTLVTLLVDGDAQHLYRKFGFEFSVPALIGMLRCL